MIARCRRPDANLDDATGRGVACGELTSCWCWFPSSVWIGTGESSSKELAEAAAASPGTARRRRPISGSRFLIPRLRRDADEDYRAKRYGRAIDDLNRAIAFGADDGLIWLPAGAVWPRPATITCRPAPTTPTRIHRSVERGNALFLIGRDYDRHDKQKDALAAFQAGLGADAVDLGRRAGRAAETAGRVPRHQGAGRCGSRRRAGLLAP